MVLWTERYIERLPKRSTWLLRSLHTEFRMRFLSKFLLQMSKTQKIEPDPKKIYDRLKFRRKCVNVIDTTWKKVKVTWHTATHTRNSCSAFNPSKVHTHSSEHTHTVNTLPEQWAAIYAAASWGFGALLKGTSVVVLMVERALVIHSPQLQFLPAETWTRNLWITSPTL